MVELEAEENSYLQGIDLLDQFKQKLPDLNFNQNSMDLNSDRFQLYKDKRSKPLSDPSKPKKPINREQSNFAFNFREQLQKITNAERAEKKSPTAHELHRQ